MKSSKHLHPILAPYVKQFHYFTLTANFSSSMTAIPTGNIFLCVWGEGFFNLERPHGEELKNSGGMYLSGQQFEIARHHVVGDPLTTIGFELTPYAIYQFFKIPQYELTSKILRIEDIWSSKGLEVYERVANEPDVLKKIALVEEFLCRRIVSEDFKSDPSIDEALFLINQSKGKIPVGKVATSLRISIRSLERKFAEALGISPKAYSKIIQFNYAFKQLAYSRKQILDIASESGYYDQSHFLSHFKRVCGKSPQQYLEEQENMLHFFKIDNDHVGLNSLANTLQKAAHLYIF